jgi:hypothetical protein
MTFLMSVAMAGSLLFTILVAASVSSHAAGKNKSVECITIKHVGGQDKPIDSLLICVGPKGQSKMGFHQDWTFGFDSPTYQMLKAFVVSQGHQGPLSTREKEYEFGTFAVTWAAKDQHNEYLVPFKSVCRYFIDMIRVVPDQKAYAAFIRVLEDLADEIGCEQHRRRCHFDVCPPG